MKRLILTLLIMTACFSCRNEQIDFYREGGEPMETSGSVILKWNRDDSALKYRIEGSVDMEFSQPLFTAETDKTEITIDETIWEDTGDHPNFLYFRVQPLYRRNKTGSWSSLLPVKLIITPEPARKEQEFPLFLWPNYTDFYANERMFYLTGIDPITGNEAFTASLPDFWDRDFKKAPNGDILILGSIQKEDGYWENQLYVLRPDGEIEKKIILSELDGMDCFALCPLSGEKILIGGSREYFREKGEPLLYLLDYHHESGEFVDCEPLDNGEKDPYWITGIVSAGGDYYLLGNIFRDMESGPSYSSWISPLEGDRMIPGPRVSLNDDTNNQIIGFLAQDRNRLYFLSHIQEQKDNPGQNIVLCYDTDERSLRKTPSIDFQIIGISLDGTGIHNGRNLVIGWGDKLAFYQGNLNQPSLNQLFEITLNIPENYLKPPLEYQMPVSIMDLEYLDHKGYLISGTTGDGEQPYVCWICLLDEEGTLLWQKYRKVNQGIDSERKRFELFASKL